MNIQLAEKNGRTFIEGAPDQLLIQTERDAVTLIGVCGEHSTERLLLYAGNFPESFFDLRSGLAGTILQKFTNYHIRVALVVPSELVHGKFREYVFEANRGDQVHTFLRRSDAEAWLTSDGTAAERAAAGEFSQDSSTSHRP